MGRTQAADHFAIRPKAWISPRTRLFQIAHRVQSYQVHPFMAGAPLGGWAEDAGCKQRLTLPAEYHREFHKRESIITTHDPHRIAVAVCKEGSPPVVRKAGHRHREYGRSRTTANETEPSHTAIVPATRLQSKLVVGVGPSSQDSAVSIEITCRLANRALCFFPRSGPGPKRELDALPSPLWCKTRKNPSAWAGNSLREAGSTPAAWKRFHRSFSQALLAN